LNSPERSAPVAELTPGLREPELLLEQKNGLVYYRFPGLADCGDLSHGIFTRLGGVSRFPFAALNLGSAVGDDPGAVQENHERVCRALGIRREALVTAHLKHTTRVLEVGSGQCGSCVGQADGLICKESGVYLSMRFADCVPLLLYDPVRRVAGIAHAGWRGTLDGVARSIAQAMIDSGCRPDDIRVGVGPSIGPCCYEVGPEVVAAARQAGWPVEGLFRPGNGARPHLDLWEANRRQFLALGIEQIEVAGLCTACHTDEFYSHRAENGRTGRFGAVIGVR
jgi:YfiH family protein